MGQLFQELKRRNVIRVAIAYAVSAWLLIQVVDALFPMLKLPEWTATFVVVLLMIGFPIALIFAWAFELTPEGIKLEKHVVRDESITHATGRKLDFIIIALLVLGMGYFTYDKFVLDPDRDASEIEAAVQSAQKEMANAAVLQGTAKSIAVLPFVDMSENQDQRWFADGLAEEILNTLVRVPDLMVSSRTSSFKYRNSDLDSPAIANELGVAHVLEGSVRRVGNRIRITAQLIRAEDGFHIWSDQFDRSAEDVISVQEDLAINIAQALKTTMDPVALEKMLRAGTRSVKAYEHYLNGLALLTRISEINDSSLPVDALNHFESAWKSDRGFAEAHAQSARIWRTQFRPSDTVGLIDIEPQQAIANFRTRMAAAIENAPDETRQMLYEAELAIFDLRGADAVSLLLQVLEVLPNSFDATVALSYAARYAGDKEGYILALQNFLRLGDINAVGEYLNGIRYFPSEDNVAMVLELVKRFPNPRAVYHAHRALLWAEEYEEANKLYPRLAKEAGALGWGAGARQACSLGDRDKAEQFFRAAQREGHITAQWYILMLLGEHEEAVSVLKPLESQEVPIVLGAYLAYEQFDPRPFPVLMSILEREGIDWPPPRDIPFACPPADD